MFISIEKIYCTLFIIILAINVKVGIVRLHNDSKELTNDLYDIDFYFFVYMKRPSDDNLSLFMVERRYV